MEHTLRFLCLNQQRISFPVSKIQKFVLHHALVFFIVQSPDKQENICSAPPPPTPKSLTLPYTVYWWLSDINQKIASYLQGQKRKFLSTILLVTRGTNWDFEMYVRVII
jgi:hypothetical protein